MSDAQVKNYIDFEHTFTDQDGAAISLAGNTGATLLLYGPGRTALSAAATVDPSPATGKVTCVYPGLLLRRGWRWQFFVTLAGGEPLYSPVFELDALPNLDG